MSSASEQYCSTPLPAKPHIRTAHARICVGPRLWPRSQAAPQKTTNRATDLIGDDMKSFRRHCRYCTANAVRKWLKLLTSSYQKVGISSQIREDRENLLFRLARFPDA